LAEGVGASGDGDEVILLLVWSKERCQRVRQGKGEREVAERERRDSPPCRFRRIPVAEFQSSGERFHRDDSVSGSRSREKWEREGWGA
jgi:hypothetical protein